ncbi:MAG: hypothetical protein SGJ27_00565 [Candidatus Melainabacteria bacterium]|nr:hypothetical protein [Candidatus Melainabacteria bacterium]
MPRSVVGGLAVDSQENSAAWLVLSGAIQGVTTSHKEQKVLENALWLLMYNVQTFENGRSALSGGNTPSFTDEWDAGQMGCGELVMLLAGRMKALAAGQVLKLEGTGGSAEEQTNEQQSAPISAFPDRNDALPG